MKQRFIYTIALLFATMQTFAQTYTYDNLNRLTKVVYGNGTTVTYGYDALGNRTSKKVSGATATTYTITTSVIPEGSGTVTGGGTYSNGATVELQAIANDGYKFQEWDDGDTNNPRTVTVTKDMNFTAHFVEDEETPAVPGDIVGDGKIDQQDLDALVMAYLNDMPATKATDLDGDGKITIADITILIGMIENSNHEAIDLGLPSGTRWASCNVEASAPEEIGEQFAWGEVVAKDEYTRDNYLYEGQDLGIISGTEYDVAHVRWGGNWQMPTRKQLLELKANCSFSEAVVNGVSGVYITGPNGNSIFFPATDSMGSSICWSGTPFGDDDRAYYIRVDDMGAFVYQRSRWEGNCVRPVEISNMTSIILTVIPEEIDFGVVKLGTDKTRDLTVTNTSNASVTVTMDGCTKYTDRFDVSDNQEMVTLAPGESKVYTVTAHGTAAGYAPTQSLLVNCDGLDEPIEVKMSSYGDDDNPIIDVTELSLNVGETADVKVKNSGYYSSIPDVDDIIELQGGGGPGASGGPIDRHHPFDNYSVSEITVKALKAGVVHITFTDNHTNHTSVLTVTVTDSSDESPAEAVDLGLPSGTLWASCNVGATKPEEYGSYFAWGETEEKSSYDWSNYSHCDGNSETCRSLDGNICGTQYDVAHVKWGNNWRMPTLNEIEELVNNSTYTVTELNSVQVMKLTGPNGNSIYLPFTGFMDGTEHKNIGYDSGYYWSGVNPYANHLAPCMVPSASGNASYDNLWDKYLGLMVRPVMSANSSVH